uniref:Uncharacterized protein n=1 Tax=Photinus pyralis TaxID=7054 RepID=A0A1Y1KNR3_PHOPY
MCITRTVITVAKATRNVRAGRKFLRELIVGSMCLIFVGGGGRGRFCVVVVGGFTPFLVGKFMFTLFLLWINFPIFWQINFTKEWSSPSRIIRAQWRQHSKIAHCTKIRHYNDAHQIILRSYKWNTFYNLKFCIPPCVVNCIQNNANIDLDLTQRATIINSFSR